MSDLKSSFMSTSSYENLSPQVITRIAREIQDLVRKPSPGIRLLHNYCDSIAEIHAEIDGPDDTPYYGGTFHIKLVLSQDFPSSPPRGFFLTKIYHPNVANNGDICVNTLKRDWTPAVTLAHIYQVIRCLLIVPFPESSLNDEAGKQFMESYDDYAKRARLMTSVHAMRKMPIEESSSNSSNSSSKVDGSAGESGGKGGGEGDDEGEGSISKGPPSPASGSSNPAALAKRKLHPNQKDLHAEKRLKESKKKGLKRL